MISVLSQEMSPDLQTLPGLSLITSKLTMIIAGHYSSGSSPTSTAAFEYHKPNY